MRDKGYDRFQEHKADHEKLLDELREITEDATDGTIGDSWPTGSSITVASETAAFRLQADDCCERIGPANRRCYRAQCAATSRELAAALELEPGTWSLSFQSRLGRIPWIRPYTPDVLSQLARGGVKRLAVICPSFVADCLETLEEIGIRAREQWRALGGEAFELIPCVNAHARWAETVAGWVRLPSGEARS